MGDVKRVTVLSVDDHPLLREGVAAIIGSQTDMVLLGAAETGADGIEKYREFRPDVTLMDLRLPDISGIEAIIAIRTLSPNARIIVLTTFEGDVEIERALKAGACGYLLKSMPPKQMVDAIRQVHAGKKLIPPEIAAHIAEHMSDDTLSKRELEVLSHVAGGNRN